jgi:hypothetical protein
MRAGNSLVGVRIGCNRLQLGRLIGVKLRFLGMDIANQRARIAGRFGGCLSGHPWDRDSRR